MKISSQYSRLLLLLLLNPLNFHTSNIWCLLLEIKLQEVSLIIHHSPHILYEIKSQSGWECQWSKDVTVQIAQQINRVQLT